MSDGQIDYNALAKQAGAINSTPATSITSTTAVQSPMISSNTPIDYNALAKQAGAIESTPVTEQSPGLISRVENAVTGPGTFAGTTVPGDTWSDLFHDPVKFVKNIPEMAGQLINKPIVKPEVVMTPEQQKAHPVATGIAEFAGGLTTPTNVGVMAVTSGLGTLPGAAGKIVPRLVAAGFSAQMLDSAFKEIPGFRAALAEGNAAEAERILTHMTLDVAATAMGSQHAFTGAEAKPLFPGMDNAIKDFAAKGLNTITAPAKAAAEAIGNIAEKQKAKTAAKVSQEDFTSGISDFKKAIPPSKSAPYEDHDIQVVNNYLEPHHQNVQPIRNVTDTIDALNHEIKGIDGKVRELIKIVPDEPIATNVLEDVRAGLEAVSNKKGFVDDGLKALEKYDLAKPTISQADSIRDELNDDNRAVMKKNAYDRSTARQTDPGFAASELAAKSLRDGVYGGLENHGVKGARDLRLDEGSLIKVRNAAEVQRFNGDKAVKGTGDNSLTKKLGKAGITGAVAATGGAVGSIAGPAGTGAGTVAGGIIGKDLAEKVLPTPDLTRDALIERRFGKTIATGEPTQPTVNLKQPEPTEPKGQQELLTDPSTLFDTGQSNLIPELTPLELAQAQSIREEPFQRILNDPGATSGEKVRAKEQIRQLQNTPLPKGLVQRAEPLGPEKPSDEDLAANAAKALEERATPYKAILNDPMATAAQKAVVHGELAKLYKQADKATETASKETKLPTVTPKPATAVEAPKDETSLFVRTQTPKAAGGSNAPLPTMSPEEHADIEKQAGRTLSNDEAQGYRLAKLNEKGAEETPKVDETKAIRQDNKEKMDKSDRHKKKAGAKTLSGE